MSYRRKDMASTSRTMSVNKFTVICLLVIAGSCFGFEGASGALPLKPLCPANFSSVFGADVQACKGDIVNPIACCETAVILQDEVFLTPYEALPADVSKITEVKRINRACRREFQRVLHDKNVTINVFQLCTYVPLFPNIDDTLRANTCIYKSLKDISLHVNLTALASVCDNSYACKPDLNSPQACGGRILSEANRFSSTSKGELEDCYIAIISRLAQSFFSRTYKTLYDVCSDSQSQFSYPPGLNPAAAPSLSRTAPAEAPSQLSGAPPPESGSSVTQSQRALAPPPPSGQSTSAAGSLRSGHVSMVMTAFVLTVGALATQ